MKRSMIVFFIAFLSLLSGRVHAGVAVICDGMPYTNVMSYVSNLNFKDLQAVVISSPFKSYDRVPASLDGPVFDFNDAGNRFQRGGFSTFLGDETALRALAEFLYRRNIALYAKADLFRQNKGYNRAFWNGADFVPDLQLYGGVLLVDIRNPETRGKMGSVFSAMKRLPIQKWMVDTRYLPADRRAEYVQFVAGNLGSSAIVLSDGDQNMPEVAHTRDYYNLRTNAFSPLQPNLKYLERYSAEGGYLHYIENETPQVNNTGPLLFLLLQRCNVLLSHRMLNRYHQAMIDMAREFGGYERQAVSSNRFIAYNRDRMIAINYSDSFANWNLPNQVGRTGLYKALASGAILKLARTNMTVFIMPKSIAFWDLRQ